MGGVRTPEEREDGASYRSSTGQGEKGGDLDLAEGEPFRRRFGPQWKRGEEVCMTKSARRVQNSGIPNLRVGLKSGHLRPQSHRS